MDGPGPNPTVDLTNCDREPIHIPGSIQSFGWMLACGDGAAVRQVSANVAELGLGAAEEQPGRRLGELFPELPADLAEWSDEGAPYDFAHQGRTLTASAHRTPQGFIVEIEPAEPANGATIPHLTMFRGLQRTRGILPTLAFAAKEIRAITGYDRVMIYRFLPDQSGEVVADDHIPELTPFLGLRYPPTDIPAQARRLYTLNPIRIIVDVQSQPVPIVPPLAADGEPLDLSNAILRSVSPIHLEYLRNMGVGASMSISIVIDGRLWGLVACHHRTPRHVSSERRALAQLLAQHISTIIDAEQRRELADAVTRGAEVQARIIGRTGAYDLLDAVAGAGDDLLSIVFARGAAVSLEGRVALIGETPPRADVLTLIERLRIRGASIWSTNALGTDEPDLAPHAAVAAGVLAIRFSPSGWIVWFRPAIERTIHWGGDPRKGVTVGPHGTRLTPRGSFELYIETVRGQADPWSAVDFDVAERLRGALVGAALERAVETSRLREMIIGTMGHDLRNPLSAISMATQMLSDSPESERQELTDSIATSTRRMKRLIDNLMELTRIQSGVGIRPEKQELDLAQLAKRICDEARLAFGVLIECASSGDTTVYADPIRIEQVLANLLSNASHHGDPQSPISVRTEGGESVVRLSVHNSGPPIPDEIRGHLFDVYTTTSAGTARGLGLGLYIVGRVVQAHQGKVDVESSAEEGTTFRVTLPRRT